MNTQSLIDGISQISAPISMEEFFATIKKSSTPIVVTTYDCHNPTILFTNQAHEKLCGFSNVDVVGQNPKIFQGKDTDKKTIETLKSGLTKFDFWDGSVVNYHKSGEKYTVYILIFGVAVSNNEKFFLAIKRKLRE